MLQTDGTEPDAGLPDAGAALEPAAGPATTMTADEPAAKQAGAGAGTQDEVGAASSRGSDTRPSSREARRNRKPVPARKSTSKKGSAAEDDPFDTRK
jgi:hypothetical protein